MILAFFIGHIGHLYLARKSKKDMLIYRLTVTAVGIVALVLEGVFFGNVKVCAIVFGASILCTSLIIYISETIIKKNYFKTLKMRISENFDIERLPNVQEIRNALNEKYDVLYGIDEIEKVKGMITTGR